MVSQRLIEELRSGKPQSMNLSFAGCGFLGIYHVGVATCIRQYAPHLAADKISGASAGSLVAAALICNLELGDATTFTLNLATKARARALGPLHPSFDISAHLRAVLEHFLPDNCHEIANGRLFVSLTRVSDRKNVLVSQFDSKEDLIQALLCSAHVPFYSGIFPPKYKGVRYVDGGLSVNNPILDENTITVSPFAGECDICPDDKSMSFLHVSLAGTSVQLNSGNLYRISHAFFPPPPEVLSDMCKQGFDDTLKFLQKNRLISCTKHLSIQSSVRTSVPYNINRYDPDRYDHQKPEPILPQQHQPQPHRQEETMSESSSDSDYSIPDELIDEDSSSEEGEDFHCEECRRHRENIMVKTLPPAVVTALQAACDSVNKGLLAPVYKLRAFKVLSLLTAPWILPLDVGIVLAKKFYDWAPYMPADMQWFVWELATLLKELVNAIQTGRHHYSARFTCQLAITDTDFTDQPVLPPTSSHHGYTSQHPQSPHVATRRRNLGMGVAVNFHSAKGRNPLKTVNKVRHNMLEDEEHHHGHYEIQTDNTEEYEVLGSPQVRRSSGNIQVPQGSAEQINAESASSHSQPSWEQEYASHMHYDTFENCLHIADQMDAIMTYYYMEEGKPNSIKVTEIYPIKESVHHNPPSPDPATMDSANDLVWDNFLEMKKESEESMVVEQRPKLRRTMSECVSSGHSMEQKFVMDKRGNDGNRESSKLSCIEEENITPAASRETISASSQS